MGNTRNLTRKEDKFVIKRNAFCFNFEITNSEGLQVRSVQLICFKVNKNSYKEKILINYEHFMLYQFKIKLIIAIL